MSTPNQVTVEFVSLDGGSTNYVKNFEQYFDELSEYEYNRPPYAEESELKVYSDPIVRIGNSTVSVEDGEYSTIRVSADFKYFYNKPDSHKRLQSYLEIIKIVYNVVEPVYGFGLNKLLPSEYGLELVPTVTAHSLQNPQIDQPAWIMIFSPKLVDCYGRDWLRSLSVDWTETLDDGGILIVTNENISDAHACAESMNALKEDFANRF